MRKIKDVLRLNNEPGISQRQIARSVGVSRTTVSDYIARAKLAGLGWPLPDDMDEIRLELLLFPPENKNTHRPRIIPLFVEIHKELKQKGVTLQLLWDEYKAKYQQDGYEYSQYCELYRQWRQILNATLRKEYKFGERLFLDFAGKGIPITDPETGTTRDCELFVAALGASNYTYVEACESQSLENWISAHTAAFEYFGGVAQILIPDNLKAGVTKPCRYEPDLNPTYYDMATHYGCVIIPARVRKPKDKPKVEAAVKIATMWITAALRKHTFFSLADVNREIRKRLEVFNSKEMKKLKISRKELFLAQEKACLRPLPSTRYVFAEITNEIVGFDYHIELAGHYYSVPYTLIKKEIEVRLTAKTVEIAYKGNRIVTHERSYQSGMTTLVEHRPKSHQMVLGWTPASVIEHAKSKIGPFAGKVFEKLMTESSHQEKGLKSCIGIISLAGKPAYKDRLEAACERALAIDSVSYKSIRSILQTGRDQIALPENKQEGPGIEHENLRGARYYE